MSHRITWQNIHAVAKDRKPGYVEAVAAAALEQTDRFVTLADKEFDRIQEEYKLGPRWEFDTNNDNAMRVKALISQGEPPNP